MIDWTIFLSFIAIVITISGSADVANVTLASHRQPTNVPVVSFVTPDSTFLPSGSPHDANKGMWFTDGYNWTRETPKSSSFDEIPLVLSALFPLNGDGWDAQGLLVTADLALKHVNDNPDILPGYRLFMSPADSKCRDGVAIQKFFEQVFQAPPKVALIGPACSAATKPIASTAHFWNLNLISPTASSPALSNRKRYPTFFRIISSETVLNLPITNLISHYNWTRVATIHHNQEFFILIIADLLTRLKQSNITVISSEGFYEDPTTHLENLKEKDAKIIIASMYENTARKVFCEIYKLGMYGEGYVWFITGWYARNWYKQKEEGVDCSVDEMTQVVESSKYIGIQEQILAEKDTMTIAGITRGQYESLLHEHLKLEKYVGYNMIPEVHFGYDSVWAAALALHQTAENFRKKVFEGDHRRGLENFSYSDYGMGDMLTKAMESVNFTGVSGPVSFRQGERIGIANIEQFQEQCGQGWRIYSSHCYLFVASQKSRDEAASLCRDEGGFLVSILSEDENKALIELGQEQISKGINQWWVSLKKSQEGDFKWSGGLPRELQWSPWEQDTLKEDDAHSNRGEDKRHGNTSTAYMEICYILDLALKSWLPVNCTTTLYCFVCKKKAEYEQVVVATYNVKKEDIEWIGDIIWPGGILPLDHTPKVLPRREEVYQGISVVVYIIICSASVCGILLSLACLTFNFRFRNQRFIKMSSPNLNSLIIIGCILIYASACMAVWDSLSVNSTIFLKLYQIRVWCFSVGFVLSFGSMFSKTWRVHKVAALKNPKRVIVTDRHLYVMVATLLFVDVILLAAWFIISPMRVKKKLLQETEDMDSMVIRQPYIQYCTSDHEQYWLGALYCYKALLLLFGVFLAWETRKVTFPALNDSKLIGLCVYNAVLLSAIGFGINLVLKHNPSVAFMFTSAIRIFGTSVTLVIIFIPKMISVIQYPDGKPVTTMKTTTDTSMETISRGEDIAELRTEIEQLRAQLSGVLQRQCPRCQQSGSGFWWINAVCGCFDGLRPKVDHAVVMQSSQTEENI